MKSRAESAVKTVMEWKEAKDLTGKQIGFENQNDSDHGQQEFYKFLQMILDGTQHKHNF